MADEPEEADERNHQPVVHAERNEREPDERAEHEGIALAEVERAGSGESKLIAERDHGVDHAERDAGHDELQEDFHDVTPRRPRAPPGQARGFMQCCTTPAASRK